MGIIKSLVIVILCFTFYISILKAFPSTTKTNYVELTGAVDEVSVRESVEAITEAGSGDRIVIQVMSEGGKIFALKRIIYAIEHSKAKVVVVVDLYAASAAAYLFTIADEQEIDDNATLIFHRPSKCSKDDTTSETVCIKITEKDTAEPEVSTFNLHKTILKLALDKKIITQEEFSRVEAGQDVWVTGREINQRRQLSK